MSGVLRKMGQGGKKKGFFGEKPLIGVLQEACKAGLCRFARWFISLVMLRVLRLQWRQRYVRFSTSIVKFNMVDFPSAHEHMGLLQADSLECSTAAFIADV
jgi:hypothetical protein